MTDFHEETLIVRDRNGTRHLAAVDSWTSMTLVASLSADPRQFDELARAWLRYRPEKLLEELSWSEGSGAEPAGPWVVLDLACLRVMAGNGSCLPEDGAAYQRDEGPAGPEMPLVWVNFPPGWRSQENVAWSEALPPLPVAAEPLDVRGVLYGRPLAEGIARRTMELARRGATPDRRVVGTDRELSGPGDELSREIASQWYDLTIQVHVDWLLTPREDLEGKPPRHFLHQGREWVEQEVDNRQTQWVRERRPPRPLDRDTFAYRYGPLGRHEVVMYFELCRQVIGAAWDRLSEAPDTEEQALVERLQEHVQWWLAEGSIDDDPTPPSAIIETERRLMPLVEDGNHFDCDCPLCRLAAEQSIGPVFQHFDGHHLELDDEFAFSLSEDREEWEAEQAEYRGWSGNSLEAEREGS